MTCPTPRKLQTEAMPGTDIVVNEIPWCLVIVFCVVTLRALASFMQVVVTSGCAFGRTILGVPALCPIHF